MLKNALHSAWPGDPAPFTHPLASTSLCGVPTVATCGPHSKIIRLVSLLSCPSCQGEAEIFRCLGVGGTNRPLPLFERPSGVRMRLRVHVQHPLSSDSSCVNVLADGNRKCSASLCSGCGHPSGKLSFFRPTEAPCQNSCARRTYEVESLGLSLHREAYHLPDITAMHNLSTLTVVPPDANVQGLSTFDSCDGSRGSLFSIPWKVLEGDRLAFWRTMR